MKAAFLNGFMGLGLTILLATGMFDFGISQAILCVFASNIAGLVSLVLTLQIERKLEGLKTWLNRSFVTWSVLVFLYFSILLNLAMPLRDLNTLAWLILPLILSTGFAMIVFGPIQDFLVRRQQTRKRIASS